MLQNMKLRRSHKIKIFPTPEQERYLRDCAFVARSAWNFALGHMLDANRAACEAWDALSDAERLLRVPPSKKDNAKEKWEALTDEDRKKRAPLSWDTAEASRAWTVAKKSAGEDSRRGLLVAKTVPATVGFDPIGQDLKKAWAAYFKDIATAGPCGRRVKGKKCWCSDFPRWMGEGHPRFKNSSDPETFSLRGTDTNGQNSVFSVEGRWLRIRDHRIRMVVPLRFGGRAASCRIVRDSTGWYACVSCEFNVADPAAPEGTPIGVDLGIKATAALSTGEVLDLTHGQCSACRGAGCDACWNSGLVRSRKRDEEKVSRLKSIRDRKGDRLPCTVCKGAATDDDGEECKKCSGSGDYLELRTVPCKKCSGTGEGDRRDGKCRACKGFGKERSQRVLVLDAKIAKAERHMANQRKDALHRETTRIAERAPSVAVFEDIDLAELRKQKAKEGRAKSEGKRARGFQKAASDAAPGEFRRQLEYKLAAKGTRVLKVNPAYTSRTCSECGHVLEKLDLSTREWTCPSCWQWHDRDVNAAQVILKRGLDVLGSLDLK